jgi:hypothetical protein
VNINELRKRYGDIWLPSKFQRESTAASSASVEMITIDESDDLQTGINLSHSPINKYSNLTLYFLYSYIENRKLKEQLDDFRKTIEQLERKNSDLSCENK